MRRSLVRPKTRRSVQNRLNALKSLHLHRRPPRSAISGLSDAELKVLIGDQANELASHVRGIGVWPGEGITRQSVRARLARLSVLAEALEQGE